MTQNALLLLCIATCVLRIHAISNREWRTMNRRINLMKFNFDNEIAKLKFETTDLRTELEFERGRTDELERALNATGVDVIGDVGDDVNHAALQKINTQLTTQSRRIHALERSVGDLQQANVAVLTELATCRSTTTHTQANMATFAVHDTRLTTLAANITGVLKDVSDITDRLYTTDNDHASEKAIKKMDAFAKSIQLAFQAEKMRLRNITTGLERGSNGVQQETVNVINRTIDAVRAVAEDNLAAIDRLETIVNVTAKDVADLQQAVDEDKLRPCCGADTGTSRPPTTTPAEPTTRRTYPTTTGTYPTTTGTYPTTTGTYPTTTGTYPTTTATYPTTTGTYPTTTGRYPTTTGTYPTTTGTYPTTTGTYPTTTGTYPTTRRTYQTTIRTDLVTMSPGGPEIYPIFGKDLKKAIKVGSRVVRCRDWHSWRDNQDGVPPVGTVYKVWSGYVASSVRVRWDTGRRSQYSVGHDRNYDFYLLGQQ